MNTPDLGDGWHRVHPHGRLLASTPIGRPRAEWPGLLSCPERVPGSWRAPWISPGIAAAIREARTTGVSRQIPGLTIVGCLGRVE